jgi:hypothetical protein
VQSIGVCENEGQVVKSGSAHWKGVVISFVKLAARVRLGILSLMRSGGKGTSI